MKITTSLKGMIIPLFLLVLMGSSLGNAFPQVAFWLGVFCFIIQFWITQRLNGPRVLFNFLKNAFRNPIAILGILTLLSFTISSIYGINPEFNLSKLNSVIVIALGGVIWFAGLRNLNSEQFQKIPRYTLIIAAATITILFLQILVWLTTGFTLHGNAFFPFLQKISTALAIVLPLAYLRLFREDKKGEWVILFLSIAAIFMCGGRSGIVAFIVVSILFIFFFPWGLAKNWASTLSKFFAVHILGAISGFVGYYLLVGRETFIQRMDSPRAYTGSGRTDIWSFSLEQFINHPFFGVGVQGFRHLDFTGMRLSSTFHPHNMIVQLLIETGLVGTALLAAFVLTILFKTIWPAHRKVMTDYSGMRPLIAACFFSIATYVVAAQFLTSFFHGWWLVIPTVLFAMLGALAIHYRKAESQEYAIRSAKIYPVKISVIMPCHNGERFLNEAIDSVLMQSEADLELILSNDGSTDGSQRIIDQRCAADPRVKSFSHEKAKGAGAARNTGLQNASGRYIAFLDCDDRWTEHKLAVQLRKMAEYQAAFSTTYYDVINEESAVIGRVIPSDHIFTFGRLLKCNDIGCSAAVIDTAMLDKGQFPDYERAQDFVYWCRILAQGYLCLCIHECLGAYRVHNKSRTLNKMQTAKNRIHLLREAMGVPLLVIPYYVALYIVYGICKQMRSGSLPRKSAP